MSLPLTPLSRWDPGTNQNSIPANDNSLRVEIFNTDGIADDVTAQPGSPADGDWYILPSTHTGTQWSTFAEDSIAIFYGGTWYEFVPSHGDRVAVAGVLMMYDETDGWEPMTVPAAPRNIFVSIAMSDMTTDLTTGTAKAVWFAPEDGELASVFIAVHDPSSSGIVRVDMNDSGGSVFTTRPAIDATEATSLTGTVAVLDGTVSFSRGDKFTFDIDDAGTDAKGLQVCVEYVPAP